MGSIDPSRWNYDHLQWEEARIADMTSPVQCSHCSGIYDLGRVTVTARYTDCSVWRSPCCARVVDDRGAGWKSRADYVELGRER